MTTLAADLHLALRRLRNAPGFTLTVLVMLALGVGLMTVAAIVAALLPALRAARTPPMQVLREE